MDEEYEPQRHKEHKVTRRLCELSRPGVLVVKKNEMIKQLRKRHLQIWILWAILLPVGIIISYMAVTNKVTQELLQQPGSKTSVSQIKTIDSLKSK